MGRTTTQLLRDFAQANPEKQQPGGYDALARTITAMEDEAGNVSEERKLQLVCSSFSTAAIEWTKVFRDSVLPMP